jgi:hypothetical protein
VGAAGSRVPWSPRERSHGVAIIGAIQREAIAATRRPDRVQIEDHVKRISRWLMDRRKQRNASGSRDSHEAADRLIQFQQQQDRVGVQHEPGRLDRYQARASQL